MGAWELLWVLLAALAIWLVVIGSQIALAVLASGGLLSGAVMTAARGEPEYWAFVGYFTWALATCLLLLSLRRDRDE